MNSSRYTKGTSLCCFIVERLNWMILLVGTFLFTFLNAGCSDAEGSARISVAGTVTLDGSPLNPGLIRFIPKGEKAGPGAMTQIVDGQFSFTSEDGPLVCDHRVEIEATDFQNFAIDDEAAFASQMEATGESPLAKNPVPPIYNTASTLSATVTPSEGQTFSFALKSL